MLNNMHTGDNNVEIFAILQHVCNTFATHVVVRWSIKNIRAHPNVKKSQLEIASKNIKKV